MILLDLFLTFARIGLFTFGGGYAMIALIEDACVEKKRWITHDEMVNVTVPGRSRSTAPLMSAASRKACRALLLRRPEWCSHRFASFF